MKQELSNCLMVMHQTPKYLIVLLLTLFISGCAQNPHPLGKPLPKLTYEHLTPYHILGGTTLVRQTYVPDVRTVSTVKGFPVSPAELLKRYAAHRFVVGENPVKMVFDVQNASLVKFTDEENVVGFLTGSAEDRYLMNIYITMSPVNAHGGLSKPFTIDMKRELFIPHNTSLAAKDIAQFEFLEKAIVDIDKIVSEMVEQRLR